MRFTKMQGLGNDFVVIETVTQSIRMTSDLAQFLANRHYGVGCDQVLVISQNDDDQADFKYEIFNADGSQVSQCGNGARCVGLFLLENDFWGKSVVRLKTNASLLQVSVQSEGVVAVNMGAPNFSPESLPFETVSDAPFLWKTPFGEMRFSVVSVGNPHCVIEISEGEKYDFSAIGFWFNQQEAFPDGVNVGFMRRIDAEQIHLTVYERGAGLTQACGSGAVAAAAIMMQGGKTSKRVTVSQAGGVLEVTRKQNEESLWLKGPAQRVFDGVICPSAFKP